jgi:hypothetical protein
MDVVKDGFGENGGRYQGVKVKRYIMVSGAEKNPHLVRQDWDSNPQPLE